MTKKVRNVHSGFGAALFILHKPRKKQAQKMPDAMPGKSDLYLFIGAAHNLNHNGFLSVKSVFGFFKNLVSVSLEHLFGYLFLTVSRQAVLNHCVSTITFSDDFVSAFYSQENSIAQSSAEIARINNETSNIITEGWANRQSSYDIISQKQSDATLGYERVYDTETNEIYKAYNGFTDDYTGSKYQAVTDDMYSSPISGYIEK